MKRCFEITVANQTVFYWLSLLCSAFAVYRLTVGEASYLWLFATLATYMAFQLSVTIGCHRLFTHRTFECGRAWHWVFAVISTLTFQSSPISWVHVHHAHHKHSDKENDPHITEWVFFFLRVYRPVVGSAGRVVAKMMKDPMHIFVHRWAVLLCLGLLSCLLAIDLNIALFAYIVPCAIYYISSAVHQVFAHWKGVPRNLQFMEFILPMGEWLHADHHRNARIWDWGKYDLGSYIIKGIKR